MHYLGKVLLALAVIGGLWFAYEKGKSAAPAAVETAGETMGVYQYQCDNETAMAVIPAADMKTIEVTLHEAPMLLAKVDGVGARYEGAGTTFVGAGEEVMFTINNTTLTCNPVPNTEEAPFNWGDAAEGGGVKQDTALIVSESVLGKWQSTTDAKFTREFKEGNVVVDSYTGEPKTDGRWIAFTKENPPTSVTSPLEDSAVYLQLSMKGSQANTLTFKIAKLTPETLELVYLERGGVLTFSRVN